jgi:hypothetical protein
MSDPFVAAYEDAFVSPTLMHGAKGDLGDMPA